MSLCRFLLALFRLQLELLLNMRDELHSLHAAGHFKYFGQGSCFPRRLLLLLFLRLRESSSLSLSS